LIQIIELILVIAALAIIFFGSRSAGGARRRLAGFEHVEGRFRRLARRKILSVVVVGLLVVALRVSLIPVLGIPAPRWNDEFSYLLAADTFAHGRVTNPTHPMWVHFETFGIIQQQTYQCIAQPGQGLILAAGQLIGGHPFWGAWFSVGVMCAAIYWMLQGWLPASWALLGGVLAVLRCVTLTYWANSYWGGALAATGAALVLGALPHVQRLRRT